MLQQMWSALVYVSTQPMGWIVPLGAALACLSLVFYLVGKGLDWVEDWRAKDPVFEERRLRVVARTGGR